jgi:hypothetical protein
VLVSVLRPRLGLHGVPALRRDVFGPGQGAVPGALPVRPGHAGQRGTGQCGDGVEAEDLQVLPAITKYRGLRRAVDLTVVVFVVFALLTRMIA